MSPKEAFQSERECVGEGFLPLQTINMHINLYNTLQERENPTLTDFMADLHEHITTCVGSPQSKCDKVTQD